MIKIPDPLPTTQSGRKELAMILTVGLGLSQYKAAELVGRSRSAILYWLNPEYHKGYHKDNRKKIVGQQNDYYERNRKKLAERQKNHRESNREKIAEYQKSYYKDNREKIAEYNKEYRKEYYQRPEVITRRFMRQCVQRCTVLAKGERPWEGKTLSDDEMMSMFGGTQEEFVKRIESQFESGMSWANHGEWHIDHKRPLASFEDDEELFAEANQLYNLQPLWAKDNLSKGSKWDSWAMEHVF
jgi:predicted transcriptional regulator